jgi:hypothetical protein
LIGKYSGGNHINEYIQTKSQIAFKDFIFPGKFNRQQILFRIGALQHHRLIMHYA